MEEIIEELREKNEPVPVPLELPDDDQLVEIEDAKPHHTAYYCPR